MTMQSQDTVALFNSDSGEQVVTLARAMRLQVTPESKAPQHPLEDGSTVVDHHIILPVEAQLLVLVTDETYADIYSQLVSLFKSGAMLLLQSRASTWDNMFIASMPHEETSDVMDGLQINVRLTEALFFKSQATASNRNTTAKPAASKNSSTSKRGEQAPRESVAHKIFG